MTPPFLTLSLSLDLSPSLWSIVTFFLNPSQDTNGFQRALQRLWNSLKKYILTFYRVSNSLVKLKKKSLLSETVVQNVSENENVNSE